MRRDVSRVLHESWHVSALVRLKKKVARKIWDLCLCPAMSRPAAWRWQFEGRGRGARVVADMHGQRAVRGLEKSQSTRVEKPKKFDRDHDGRGTVVRLVLMLRDRYASVLLAYAERAAQTAQTARTA
jgi:redox-regulated HSP33 family molecular chaperone